MKRYQSIPLRLWLPIIILSAFAVMLVASTLWHYRQESIKLEQDTSSLSDLPQQKEHIKTINCIVRAV